uniref:Troponin I4a n=1 Tax=Cyprinus carpio TaxID=7962 RepID=A0A8C1WYJ6_CYPCA
IGSFLQKKPKISASRRLFLKTKILKKASTLLAEEKEQKKIDREQTLSERLPPLKLSGLSIQDIQNLCKELHQKIDVVDEERYDFESKVVKNDKEIGDLNHKVFELKGKMKRPALKRVRVSADAMLGALLGARHKESIDFKANLKTVKKEEEKVRMNIRFNISILHFFVYQNMHLLHFPQKEEVTDWRKNVDAMSGMEGRKKLFAGPTAQ